METTTSINKHMVKKKMVLVSITFKSWLIKEDDGLLIEWEKIEAKLPTINAKSWTQSKLLSYYKNMKEASAKACP